MNILNEHEKFELEVLERMRNAKMLEPLVFGGGTMLRLCYELNRYSVDLDFWFIKRVAYSKYFQKLKDVLAEWYQITDAQIKFYTILLEVRSPQYPQRLKIEIRKGLKTCDFQERIAFSKDSSRQVILRVHTLEQSMKNKVAAFLERSEIRDAFDIEFLLRKGVSLPDLSQAKRSRLSSILRGFKAQDYKVKLGSILDSQMREYYMKNKFEYLLQKLI